MTAQARHAVFRVKCHSWGVILGLGICPEDANPNSNLPRFLPACEARLCNITMMIMIAAVAFLKCWARTQPCSMHSYLNLDFMSLQGRNYSHFIDEATEAQGS